MNSVEIKERISDLKKKCLDALEICKQEIRDLNESENKMIEDSKIEIRNLKRELDILNEEYQIETRNSETNINNLNKNKKIMNKEFRLLKTINDVANNRNLSDEATAVIEAGVEEMRNSGLSYGGQIQIPVSELRANITVGSATGDGAVGVDTTDFLEPLRAKNVLINAGAKFLTGLVGDVLVPTIGASNVSWEGEVGDHDGGSAASGVKLQPHRLTCYVDVSKQFLSQTSDSAENLLKNDLIRAINEKLESTILGSAAGSTTQPAGIFYTTASGGLGTYGTYARITELESLVEDANVMGECSYIMSNKAKAAYRSAVKGSTTGGFICENNSIDGTPVYSTSNVENKNVAYGDWSQLAIGQWGAIDLTVDPYTVAKDGKVRIVVNAFFDAKVLRDGAIKVGKQG